MPDAPRPAGPRTRLKGTHVAIAMVVLWLAILIAVYVVIVQLKLGGSEGTMREPPAPSETAPATAD